MEMLQARRLSKILIVVFMSLILAACGADESDDPTSIAEPSDAQPTVPTDDEADEPTGQEITDITGTPLPTDIDMSSASDVATPQGDAPGTATPAPVTPVADDLVVAGTPDDASVPGATPAVGILPEDGSDDVSTAPESGEGTQANEELGDGTTGPSVILADATPAGSDEAQTATPDPAGAAADVNVTGCDVENVPPFAGETSSHVLTVDVNFRSGPGTDCDLLLGEPLGEGQQVEVIGGPVVREDDGSEWVQIQFVDTDGWVSYELLEPIG